jgi:hypothetical protein
VWTVEYYIERLNNLVHCNKIPIRKSVVDSFRSSLYTHAETKS